MWPNPVESMMGSWSNKRCSTSQARKVPSMIDLTPTTLKVNDSRISQDLAKAERYHALTRNDRVTGKQSGERPAVRWPHISIVCRLVNALPRPA
jgi:hypothetical protein